MTGLGTCRTCGREVAQTARACPHCGQRSPAAAADARPEWATLLMALVFAGVAISVIAAVWR